MNNKYKKLFDILSENLDFFIETTKNGKLSLRATDEWSVKENFCHIVFWHETYAANYKALAQHKKPPLPEGLSTINKRGVAPLKKYSTEELIKRLRKAHNSLYSSIVEKGVSQMTYSKGGRTYKTDEFLKMVTGHIRTHTRYARRAKEGRIPK